MGVKNASLRNRLVSEQLPYPPEKSAKRKAATGREGSMEGEEGDEEEEEEEDDGAPLDPSSLVVAANAAAVAADEAGAKAERAAAAAAASSRRRNANAAPYSLRGPPAAQLQGAGGSGRPPAAQSRPPAAASAASDAESSWPLFIIADANPAAATRSSCHLNAAAMADPKGNRVPPRGGGGGGGGGMEEEEDGRATYLVGLPSQRHLYEIRGIRALATVLASAIAARLEFIQPGTTTTRYVGSMIKAS
jgi:hypothetical protein